jgi:hypothetical protein
MVASEVNRGGARAKARHLWRGLCVKVFDGTSTSLPDTLKNQRAYPPTRWTEARMLFPALEKRRRVQPACAIALDFTPRAPGGGLC